jgi:tetratricopeptide (TPR) repeat protein
MMQGVVHKLTRTVLLPAALLLAVVSIGAQSRGAGGDPVRQVRTALAHGDISGARAIASGATDPAVAAVALALIELFTGRDDEARERLIPVATANPLGEAAVELGLLEQRTGNADGAFRWLDPVASIRQFNSPDDYFRLARAAVGIGEFQLANDAFQRIDAEPRADIQTAWADLFLRYHQNGDAAMSYQRALELDPQWVPAMIGLARAVAPENPPAARELLARAAKVAPEHPDLNLALAEQALSGEDVEAAEAALDAVARVRPGSVEEAAYRAAITYARSGLADAQAAAAAVGVTGPRAALAYRLAGEQAAREYRFDEAAVLARAAAELDPADPVAQFNLGLYLMRTGDEAAARTALETSWDLDSSSPSTKNLLDVLDKLETFRVAVRGPFIFKFAPEEADVLEAYALPLATEAYELFGDRYGVRPDQPILIEIFPVHDDFAVRTLGLPGLVGALGACFGRVVTMDSPRARPPGDFSWQATLWHELAHVFTLHASGFRVPRWLTEGVSVYEEHLRNPAWGRELTLQFARALAAGQTFGVRNLPQAFKRPESLALAYFEASLLVEHLVAVNGEAGLRTLLQAYGDGLDDEAAFVRSFGQNIEQIEVSFAQFVAARYGDLPAAMKDPDPALTSDDVQLLAARAAAEPGSFQVQLAYGRALVRAERFDEAGPVLERAHALAPMATGEGSPRALLATIAEARHDIEAARRQWRALLVDDHTNIAAARRLAALAAEGGAAASDDRDFALRLIADLDPFDAGVHVELGRRLLERGDFAGALVEFDAALATNPPNRVEAQTDRAEALMRLGRNDEARRQIFTVLETAPGYARAQDLLLMIMGR